MELLAPAGNIKKLEASFQYGADACYIGLDSFSLRHTDKSFGYGELEYAISYAKKLDKKLYVTANIFAYNNDLPGLKEFFKWIDKMSVDGLIISDLGVFNLAKKYAKNTPLHISTQSNILNYETAKMWERLGAQRLILARELHIDDVKKIADKTKCEIEVFVHGAMCMAYSGRCFMSSYMAARDANQGDCAQPCRWEYALQEEKRPGEYFPVDEDEKGGYVFNSKDLCLINRLEELKNAGVASLKIEGRMKSEYYVATVVRAYRSELDRIFSGASSILAWDELQKVSHRAYTEGFMFGKRDLEISDGASYIRSSQLLGVVIESDGEFIKCAQRNKLSFGDSLEIMTPKNNYIIESCELYIDDPENDSSGSRQLIKAQCLPHPEQVFYLKAPLNVPENSFIRSSLKNELLLDCFDLNF